MMAVSSPEFERAFTPREQRWELRRRTGLPGALPMRCLPTNSEHRGPGERRHSTP